MVAPTGPTVGRLPTVLVTGFEPFGGQEVNPSWIAAQALHNGAQPVDTPVIHVPWLPGQGQPSMRLDEIVMGLRVAIGCALVNVEDIRKEAGALS